MKNAVLVLCGALAGGALGFLACRWVASHRFSGMVLPGGLLGLGAGVARNRSVVLAVVCGLLATALGFFTDWWLFPFVKDAGWAFSSPTSLIWTRSRS